MIESEADRLEYLRTFGLPVRHANSQFQAIFDAAYQDDLGVEESGPVLQARTVDVVTLTKGATLTVNDKIYTLRRSEPDGTGMSILRLGS